MNKVGIDHHKKYSIFVALNEGGDVIRSQKMPNHPELMGSFFKEIGPSDVVLEASRNWGALYDLLEEMKNVHSIQLAHPQKVRVIAQAQIKTDRIDGHCLAQLLRLNWVPTSYIPGKETRLFREMIRQRLFLTRMRTRVKNRLHGLIDRLHLPQPPVKSLFGKRGIHYWRGLNLPGIDGEILREDLRLLEVLNQLIQEAEGTIDQAMAEDPRLQLLRTIPGVGAILSAVIALEIDQIERFARPEKLAAYAGLVPTTHASGGKVFHGRLLPMCNKWLRWALVEAAWCSIQDSPYCRAFFQDRTRQKGKKTAVVALARRLAEIIWHVWTERRPYEERPIYRPKPIPRLATSPAALISD